MVLSNSGSLALALALMLLRVTALGAVTDDAGKPDAERPAAGADAALETIETFHRQLVGLAANPGEGLALRVAALTPVVVATHDFQYIARFTLRRQWQGFTPEQRASFVEAFSQLSVMTYATRFDEVTASSFSIKGVSAAGRGRIQVEAFINRPEGAPIPLNYLLQAGDHGWRIINIIADGVSDLALKRAEYQRVFADVGLPGLLAHIQQLTASMDNSS
jgi:phospholipid transport system substrate-binding protein